MRKVLKEARIRAGYTQQQIAVRLGTSQQTISKYERAIITPQHFRQLREYEQLLGVGAEQLFPDVFKKSQI